MPNRRRLLTALSVAAALMAGADIIRADAPPALHGIVAGAFFTPPSGAALSSSVPSHYGFAKVCLDTNDNGACDAGETATATDINGTFDLTVPAPGPLAAEISTASTNGGHPVAARVTLRAAAAQAADGSIVISPLSTEVTRMMADGVIDYATARRQLAARLDVSESLVLSDPAAVADAIVRGSLLKESVILASRFTLAAKMADRHDAPTMKDALQASMSLEAIPRYDHIFIIMLENKATSSIKNSPFAPRINGYLAAGNQFTSYFATGNPSEPNRVAVASGDDFGITDDSAWNCGPAGDTADLPDDPLPPGMAPCTNTTNHNVKNKPNLLTAMNAAGMTWRVYSESMNPGRDWRLNSAGDNTILADDHVYPAASPIGAIGTPGLQLRMPSSLYATKHNESVNFQAVRSAPDFVANNRTLGGGQWDEALRNAPSTPPGWNFDQFGADLASGDIGNLNFLESDQCDDMHGVTVQGTVPPSQTLKTASDCGGNANIYRGDIYTDALIRKIQAANVWTSTAKRTAIVIMFDEGTATTGFNSCCGWNPSAGASIAGNSLGALVENPDGTVSMDPIARYNQGNKGHGTSIFGVLTNQPNAPKGVVDSDAHSHISFVRTLQDMFGLADPGDDWSYMNRSKYTEQFIAANLSLLPEYASSADPHFDAVRPMNHQYVIPAGYAQKSGFVTPPGAQIGPDATQLNVWATKYAPPVTVATLTPLPNAAGWNQSGVTISLQATDAPFGPGIDHLAYSASGAQTVPATVAPGASAAFQITAEGLSTAMFFATGVASSVEVAETIPVRIDVTPPVVMGSTSAAPNANGWISVTPVSVSFHCADALSGVAVDVPPPTVLTSEGAGQAATASCTDAAGNVGSLTLQNINIDATAPSIAAPPSQTAVESAPGGATVTYPTPVATDGGSGVASTTCVPASGSFFHLGATSVTCTATDRAGNSSSALFNVLVASAPDGRMFGVGYLAGRGARQNFVFRVSQLRLRDYARLEYWVNDSRRCGDRDDHDRGRDYDGDHDHDYGREHCFPGNRFESTVVTGAVFSDDPDFRPGRGHQPDIDSVIFTGSGKWNGRSGYSFEARASDQGESGRHRDTFSLVVKDAAGVVVADIDGDLDGGNIQSTRIR